MSKIVIQKKRNRVTVTNRLTYPEALNERVNNAIASGMFQYCLPVTVKRKRRETRIECCVEGLITLNQYFCGLVTKKMFLDVAYQMALVIKSCEKNMVSSNNLDLEKDRIFIDPITKSVKCIYWPIVNNQRSDPPNVFLRQMPYNITFNPNEDLSYLEKYAAFFEGYQPFSVNNFVRLILKLQGRKTGNTSQSLTDAPKMTPSEHLGKEKAPKAEPVKTADNVEYDPFSVPSAAAAQQTGPAGRQGASEGEYIFCTSCGRKNDAKANFCFYCGTKLHKITAHAKPSWGEAPSAQEPEGTVVLGAEVGGTVVLGYDEPQEPVLPTLTRKKNGEQCRINKPVFIVGTDKFSCDMIIKDNNFISRKHLRIVTRDQRYFAIADRNSTNKTYVDGKVIARETETEIFDGTVICLANEDFAFSLK